jgi:protein TonB
MRADGAQEAAPSQQASLPRTAFVSDAQSLDRPALPVGVNLAGAGQSPLSALDLTVPAGPRVVARPAAAGVATRLQVSTGVMQGRLLAPIRPHYPAIARLTHSEGTVVVKAIISTSGTIESAQVVSGPAMLQAAALDAVKQARYRPFLLNNQPTAVETTISITFRMES